jgi:hypothetical protein
MGSQIQISKLAIQYVEFVLFLSVTESDTFLAFKCVARRKWREDVLALEREQQNHPKKLATIRQRRQSR